MVMQVDFFPLAQNPDGEFECQLGAACWALVGGSLLAVVRQSFSSVFSCPRSFLFFFHMVGKWSSSGALLAVAPPEDATWFTKRSKVV